MVNESSNMKLSVNNQKDVKMVIIEMHYICSQELR